MNKICAIFASPRRDSFSSSLHDSFLSGSGISGEISRFSPIEMNIAACKGCDFCSHNADCVIQDDMQILYKQLKESQIITLSYPLYFSGLPSPLKALIDRCQALWQQRENGIWTPPPTRRAIIIASAGKCYRGMFSPSLTILRHFFNTLGVKIDLETSMFYCNTDSTPEKIRVFNDYTDTINGNC